MKVHFKLTGDLLNKVLDDLRRPHPFAEERMGFIACKPSWSREGLLLLAHSFLSTPDGWYVDDDDFGCVFGPDAIRAAMQYSLDKKACMFHVHLHDHDGLPWFSRIDLKESANFVPDFFNIRPDIPHGAVVLSNNGAAGLCWFPARLKPQRIDKITAVGLRMRNLGLVDQYSRQSFLGSESEQILLSIRAGIVGLGGGGSHIAQQLAHIGVGHFALFDPDTMEFPNLNRTVGATFDDAIKGTPKVRVAERLIKSVNPYAGVWPLRNHWQKEFPTLRACDVVFGSLDGFANRAQLEETCRRALIPLIDIGMDVFKASPYSIAGQVVASIPGRPCFRCAQFVTDEDLREEGRRYGDAGGNPQVIWPNGVLASTAVGLFVQMLSSWGPLEIGSAFIGYDGDRLTLESDVRLECAPECKHFDHIADLGDPFWKADEWEMH